MRHQAPRFQTRDARRGSRPARLKLAAGFFAILAASCAGDGTAIREETETTGANAPSAGKPLAPQASRARGPLGEPGCPGLDWQPLFRKAELELQAGELEEARRTLLCAVRLNPWSEAAIQALEELECTLYSQLLSDAENRLQSGALREAVSILKKAASLSPPPEGPVAAVRLLEKHGFRFYAGEWVTEDEAIVREKRDSRLAETRLRELPMAERLAVFREEDIRVYSDIPSGRFRPIALRIQRLIRELRLAYRDLFFPLSLASDSASGGVDVVVFGDQGLYEQVTETRGTMGMFLPRYRASFFFLGEKDFEHIAPVILHEVCHQLDDRILGLRFPPPWLQEGLAVLFEGAALGPGGEIEELGELRPRERARVREAASSEERWLGVEKLLRTAKIEGPYESPAVLDFYAQSGFLVRFLIDDPVFGRGLFYRLVEKARDPSSSPEEVWREFQEALRARGETASEFEARFRRAASEL